jgi:MFS family permease
MCILDTSIVHIALPSIQSDLHISTPQLQWVVTAYMLGFGGFLLLRGRVGDLFGRRLTLMTGLGLVIVSSFICGLSSEAAYLIVARAFQ